MNIGPVNVSETIEWDPFLDVIANLLKAKPENLRVGTFEWKWLKPASSPWLPLQNSGGLVSMLKKVKTKTDAYIILRTHAPEPDRTTAALPWSQTLGDAPGGIADEEDRSDLEEGGPPKRVSIENEQCDVLTQFFVQQRLDDVLEQIVAKLEEKYPAGRCNIHPDLPCFHHRASNLHFNLDRPRLLVWAQSIKAETATYEKVPIASPMFKAALALKRPSKNAAEMTKAAPATPAPATEAEGPQMPLPYAQFPQMPQTPFGMPPMMGYGMPFGNPYMQWPTMPPQPPMTPCPRTSDEQPSSPIVPPCSVTDFCHQYELGVEAETGLEELGFVMGDDLKSVTEAQYVQAGFKPLAWQRVLKAYKKYKRDNLL